MPSNSKPWRDLPYDVNANIPDFRSILMLPDPYFPYSYPNWLDLPSDITANILHRLGPIFILLNAQRVCTTWYKIFKDPAMWSVIYIHAKYYLKDYITRSNRLKLYKHAVDRSQGQLLEINIEYFCTIELLHYIADHSSKLRRLKLSCLEDTVRDGLGEVLQKLPLLEELSLCHTKIYVEGIEVAGRYCPLLKTLKINGQAHWLYFLNEYAHVTYNKKPVAISKSFPKLLHLQLIGNSMNNIGLEAILDGCPHLESLDLRRCPNISLAGDLGIRCSQQIKYLRLPRDSLEDYKFNAYIDRWCYSCGHTSWHYSRCRFYGIELPSWDNVDCDGCSNYDGYFTKFDESNNYDDFPIVEESNDNDDFTEFEDSADWENWENFKTVFEMSYKIKTKDERRHFRKVQPKRKKKAIQKVVSKWKTTAMLDQFNKKKKERKRGHFRKFLVDPEFKCQREK